MARAGKERETHEEPSRKFKLMYKRRLALSCVQAKKEEKGNRKEAAGK